MPELDDICIDFITKQPLATGGVLALGNFDGVHLGHQAVIAAAKEQAEKRGVAVHCLTFEPHPYSLFRKEGPSFILTVPEIKARWLHEAGVVNILTLHFTPAFATLTPYEFIQKILLHGAQAAHVVVGFDFVFGSGRGGGRDELRRVLDPYGVGVTEVPPVRDSGGEIISSTRIRSFIKQGLIESANTLLGHPFIISGIIERGNQRGRTLGFPTANIGMGKLVRPLYGVYVVRARKAGTENWIEGMANIGIRPSIGGEKELLEVHLFNFDQDIYGQEWEVALIHFTRPEQSFSSLDALKAQIQKDKIQALTLLKHLEEVEV